MKKMNHTKYAILGILTTGCNTGYAIKQLIDQSLNHFWKISYGQIYPTLKKLVADGLATVQVIPQEGKPDRKEYYLTTTGKLELQKWLQQPISEIPVEKNELLLKLFFSSHQSNASTIQHLEHYRDKLSESYNTYKEIEKMITSYPSNENDAQFWIFTLDYGIRTTLAAIEWCDATIQEIQNKEDLNGQTDI
ncbi:PadR family transcriptional regulator [Virgibacillus sp. C22-A2]|uniref:PadR family transcriptional regulator n=1 Tax=Virgibacillus tibetensis TaxID=3042313 RepID=A0ABU6KIH3_9BACI|nr:PadR family transcriptional regulator [Virgibacillus sp. C22-A2]